MTEAGMHLVNAQKRQQGIAPMQGIAGWVLAMLGRQTLFSFSPRRTPRKHMRVVETLPMGPKRHLYLVSCDGERFLVGGGNDSVQTIVRVRPESANLGLVRGGE